MTDDNGSIDAVSVVPRLLRTDDYLPTHMGDFGSLVRTLERFRGEVEMPFASVLDAYCAATGYTNKSIAQHCGISPSVLTRYRKGERTPEPESTVIGKLARGISEISREVGIESTSNATVVKNALESSLVGSHMLGMSFSSRIDSLMNLLEMRNVTLARDLGVSPSYISRIRGGQRNPSDRLAFAEVLSQLAAQRCIERGMLNELMSLIDSVGEVIDRSNPALDKKSDLAEIISQWLLGNNLIQSDIAAIEGFFTKLDSRYFNSVLDCIAGLELVDPEFSEEGPRSQFFYNVVGMREAELLFFCTAILHDVDVVFLSSDMPMLEMAVDNDFVTEYRRSVATLVRKGCHIVVIHSAERSIRSTIRALELWAPLYIDGRVTPYYLKGVSNRLFCHVNNVCDACVVAAEAVMGHQADGRYYFSTLPEDIEYYQKKMSHILAHTSSLLEIYRDADADQKKRFDELVADLEVRDEGREVCAGRYENLKIVAYPGSCFIVSLLSDPVLHIVIRHPKMRYAISCMK